MKFIDEATITVQSGNGGRGCVSFLRARLTPKGGPDGGDGGRGGDVIITASLRRRTLLEFRYKSEYKAPNGQGGLGSQKNGAGGANLVLEVPPGTLVFDAETNELIHDLVRDGDSFVVAKGGRGGQGNMRFKSSTNRTPRFAQPGEPGEIRTIRLELRLLADVGIIGFPNAGKSTLISMISAAKPKIADYPFTTTVPNLGVVKPDDAEPFVVADIPGLIEGAHEGAGLGTRFLRHIDRTRVLVHLIDASEIDADDPWSRYRAINAELERYSPELARKPQMVVLNKMELPGADVAAELMAEAAPDLKFLTISAATGQGVKQLVRKLTGLLARLSPPPAEETEPAAAPVPEEGDGGESDRETES